MRIGFGNDVHRLVEGRDFLLGGIRLDWTKGEDAHSDGDVLLHAIIDALLGATADGDIGSHFPPGDPEWKDADSKEMLRSLRFTESHVIHNLDATVTLEGLKLRPHIDAIRSSVASILGMDVSLVSIKAKTNEGLDEIGKGNAVKAEVVVLID